MTKKSFTEFLKNMKMVEQEIKKVIIGQEKMVRAVLTALLCGEHLLIEGVPGIGKTKTVNVLSKVVDIKFQRIQCTPDLLPSDITGTAVVQETEKGKRTFEIETGPIVANLLLVDEINRTSPKTQSAFLEAMQERQFTIRKQTFKLEEPFVILATQNPIEHEGTYPLPRAQQDRFLMKINVSYPDFNEELEIVDQQAISGEENLNVIINRLQLLEIKGFIGDEIYVSERARNFAVKIVSATRPQINPELKDLIKWGASPRASIYLVKAAKVQAFFGGRDYITLRDIATVAPDVLRHRIILDYRHENEEIEDIIERILREVKGYDQDL